MPKSDFLLVPLGSADIPLDFGIDFKTGDVGGRDAARVVSLCEAAMADGYVVGHHPCQRLLRVAGSHQNRQGTQAALVHSADTGE